MNDFLKSINNTYYEYNNGDSWGIIKICVDICGEVYIKPLFCSSTNIDIKNLNGNDAISFLKKNNFRKSTKRKYDKAEKILLDFGKVVGEIKEFIK